MKYNNQRKAFTLIELIFIMVVVGILSIVAIPRLAANRADANAATCAQEVQSLISEISQTYVFNGYSKFSTLPIEDITNIRVAVVEKDGISSAQGTFVLQGITYMCDSEDIVEIKGALSGTEYNLTVTDLNPTTPPAAVIAAKLLRKLNGISTAGGSKIYRLD